MAEPPVDRKIYIVEIDEKTSLRNMTGSTVYLNGTTALESDAVAEFSGSMSSLMRDGLILLNYRRNVKFSGLDVGLILERDAIAGHINLIWGEGFNDYVTFQPKPNNVGNRTVVTNNAGSTVYLNDATPVDSGARAAIPGTLSSLKWDGLLLRNYERDIVLDGMGIEKLTIERNAVAGHLDLRWSEGLNDVVTFKPTTYEVIINKATVIANRTESDVYLNNQTPLFSGEAAMILGGLSSLRSDDVLFLNYEERKIENDDFTLIIEPDIVEGNLNLKWGDGFNVNSYVTFKSKPRREQQESY
ncbi:hypothetical protein H0H92_011344 [Tricholoma furcatifolium]|nr:hypothetical protein H0H92_011344 [Tricholoma furcatifolium]